MIVVIQKVTISITFLKKDLVISLEIPQDMGKQHGSFEFGTGQSRATGPLSHPAPVRWPLVCTTWGDLLELTWVTIAASLSMGLGAAFLFIFAVKRDWFRDIEDAKYQVFWSDRGGSTKSSSGEAADGSESEKKQ
jgi:hypothetical protein